jgi:hypothetical protein
VVADLGGSDPAAGTVPDPAAPVTVPDPAAPVTVPDPAAPVTAFFGGS